MKIVDMKVRTVAIPKATHVARVGGKKVEWVLRVQSYGDNYHVIRLLAGR